MNNEELKQALLNLVREYKENDDFDAQGELETILANADNRWTAGYIQCAFEEADDVVDGIEMLETVDQWDATFWDIT